MLVLIECVLMVVMTYSCACMKTRGCCDDDARRDDSADGGVGGGRGGDD